jgi:hypothetical protein
MSLTHSPSIVADGLILYLDAANTRSYPKSGTAWTDLSGNGRNAIKAGSQSPTYPQYNSKGFFTFTGGVVADNYSRFDVANIPSFSNLSVFVWYRTSDTTNSKTILRMDNSDFELSVNVASNFYVAAGTNFNDINAQATTAEITNGLWHNMGLTFDGINLKGFLDARQISSNTRGSSTTTAAGTLRIGTRDDVYAQHFFGDIALVKIYNKTLTANEVGRNFNAMRGRFGV